MKRLFFAILPFALLLAFTHGASYACGSDCEIKETPAKRYPPLRKSCCTEYKQSKSCCEQPVSGPQSDDHDCGGNCDGKCCGHCCCPTAHTGAIVIAELIFHLSQPEPAHIDIPYSDPFMSSISLDIWLPPNIRA